MQLKKDAIRRIKIIVTVIVVLTIIVLLVMKVCAEIDRNKPRDRPITKKMYYNNGVWVTAPFNMLVHRYAKRPTDLEPFPSMEDNFSQHLQLKRHWKKIRKEVLGVYYKGDMKKIKNDLFFQNIADDKWKRFYIKWYGPSLSDAQEKLPFTTELIDSIPEIKSAMISVLEPGSIITPHTGPYKGVLRYHLGLKVPSGPTRHKCRIKVDGQKYSWKDGEDVLFDDTFIHEVHNDTDQVRIVLFCDIQRQLKGPVVNRLIDLSMLVARITTRNNK